MQDTRSHIQAFIAAAGENKDDAAFLFGYVMKDIPDTTLCAALNALSKHHLELISLQQLQAEDTLEELLDPRD